MKRLVVFLALLFALAIPVGADVYSDQLGQSGASALYDSLPRETQDIFDSLDIDLADTDWVSGINAENIFSLIKNFIASGGKAPLATGSALLALILVISAFSLFGEGESRLPVAYISALSVSVVALVPVFTVIKTAVSSLKAGAQFMLSFIPVYGAVLFASGKPVTGAASGALLLAASEGVVQLSAYILTPLIGAYMSLCLCGTLSPLAIGESLSELVKRVSLWGTGFVSTVYIGILGFQTTVNGAADSLALRTGKFLVGSFVPVVGGAVSEALTTVQSCVEMLRASVGIYGAVALALILLPVITELLLWRLMLLLCASAATAFGLKGIPSVLRSADAALSFLLGILLICGLAFIISVTVLVSAGG